MVKHLLLFASFVGVSAAALADDLRATAITEAGNAQKVTASVKETAEDSVRWRFPCNFSLSFTQAGFNKNWTGGGTNNISYIANANINANYVRDRHVWNNNLFAEYGGLFSNDLDVAPFFDKYRKTSDRFELNSKYGYQSAKFKSLYYSALLNFKTQLTRGYEYDDTSRNQVSDFLSPANGVIALGMDYKPNKYVSVFLSPLTGRFVGVHNHYGDRDTVGVDENGNEVVNSVHDTLRYDLWAKYGVEKSVEPSLGAYLRIMNDFDIVKNIHLKSNLDFFSPYTAWTYKTAEMEDGKAKHDNYFLTKAIVNWDFLLSMKITKFISTSLHTQYVFDPNVAFYHLDKDGNKLSNEAIHSRSQFMYQYSIGFAYNF